MKVSLAISLDDVVDAFRVGFSIGRKKQRLLPYFNYTVETKPKTKGNCMLDVKITNEEQVTVHIAPKTASGKPAAVDGAPQWSVLSGDVTIQPSTDGLSCTIVSSDNPGTSEVTVKADADVGEGVEEIADLVTVIVGGAKASSLGLTVDAPVPKP